MSRMVKYETWGSDDATTNLYATAVKISVRVIPSLSEVSSKEPSRLMEQESGDNRVSTHIGITTFDK